MQNITREPLRNFIIYPIDMIWCIFHISFYVLVQLQSPLGKYSKIHIPVLVLRVKELWKFSVFLFSMLDSTDSAIYNTYKTMKILPPFAIVVNTSTAVAIIAAWFVIACCACWCVLYSNKFLVACPRYIQQILYYPFLWVIFSNLQINI